MKLLTISDGRYNGGVGAKRRYGSSTLTTFWVFRVEDKENYDLHVKVTVGGRTPGERSTEAKRIAEPMIRDLLVQKHIIV
jgi:hypothetical protein